MSKKNERADLMLSLLEEQGSLSFNELSDLLNVSEMTVRRDVASLQEANLVMRGAKVGTVMLVPQNETFPRRYELFQEEKKSAPEKERIGRFAANLVEPSDTIIIDTGTTTVRMIAPIPDEYSFSALCFDFNVFRELDRKSQADIVLCGGTYMRSTGSFSSEEIVEMISRFRANKFFVSASGIHQKLGLTCGYRYELPIKRAAIHASLTKILLADSSKFGCIRTAYFGELKEIDVIVTDTGLSSEWEQRIRNMGIDLYLV